MLKATSSSESNDEVNTHFSVAFPGECTPWTPALLNTTMYCACYFLQTKCFCCFFLGGGGGVCTLLQNIKFSKRLVDFF